MDTAPILLVDDDPALLHALPRMLSLRMSGVEVQTAESAQVALTMIEQQEYDAIVSDIKMSGMDGLGLLAKVQEHHPETPVVLILGRACMFYLKCLDRTYLFAKLYIGYIWFISDKLSLMRCYSHGYSTDFVGR